ncbi:O-antigen ligase family protein [Acidimicrobiaceae bacterium]|jgi:hypothetical protein|nr:O-antigen ligase family protein [Acidimicrobiaceae bacterium]
MNNLIDNKYFGKFVQVLQILLFVFLVLTMLFNRSFVGLYIFGFRLGELLTLVGLLIGIIFLSLPKKYLRDFYFNDLQFYSLKIIVLSYFIIGFLTNANFLNTYSYKSSSYIWTTFFLFLGIIINFQSKISFEKLSILLIFIPFFTYLFSSGNYPNVFIDFFKENSDKFQFLKASDIFIGYASVNFLMKYILKSQNRRFLFFLITSGLLLPLLLFASRGSFLGVLIYMTFEIFYSRKYILNNKTRVFIYILISSIFFSFSTLRIDRVELARPTVEEIIKVANPSTISESITSLAQEKETVTVIFSFYMHYGRLESTDPTTNWRLDIWQDVIFDMFGENRVLTGYGYNEIFPQMLDPTAPGRLGRDGMNEHVHNYFVNIFARGGIFQLFIFLIFHLGLIKYWKDNNQNNQILTYMVPVFIVSSLDITLEGVQFPFIYYFFLYYFLKNSTRVKVVELYG